MFPPERIGRFFAFAALAYGLLMVPWPGLVEGYGHLFRGAGNILFARFWFWPDGGVRFLDLNNLQPGQLAPGTPPITAEGTFDTLMELQSRRAPGSVGYLRISSRYVGYGPTALVAALMVATPTTRVRKVWVLVWAMLLIHGFIAFRLTLTLTAAGFAAEKAYALFHPGPFWRAVLARAESVFSDDPTVSFVIPACIWFLVAMPYSHWKKPKPPSGRQAAD